MVSMSLLSIEVRGASVGSSLYTLQCSHGLVLLASLMVTACTVCSLSLSDCSTVQKLSLAFPVHYAELCVPSTKLAACISAMLCSCASCALALVDRCMRYISFCVASSDMAM
jgi:hypothetical protein